MVSVTLQVNSRAAGAEYAAEYAEENMVAESISCLPTGVRLHLPLGLEYR